MYVCKYVKSTRLVVVGLGKKRSWGQDLQGSQGSKHPIPLYGVTILTLPHPPNCRLFAS